MTTPPSAREPDNPVAGHWALDPSVTYLNHGSFGACPRPVLAAQDALRDRMESEAVRFFVEEYDGLMDRSRSLVAGLINADPRDLVFVSNATTAVATVLANTTLSPGDRVVANAHEYPACLHNAERACARAGAELVVAPLPLPAASAGELYDAVMSRVTPRTRLVLVSQVTSPSALALPIARIVAELNRLGIDSLVDGAHGAGCVPVDLAALSPTYYTSNAHKWLCSPKGAAVLYVRRDRHPGFRPLVLSNKAKAPQGDRPRLHVEFDYCGTADPTAAMAVGDAVRFVGSLVPDGWPGVMRMNHELAMAGRRLLLAELARDVGLEPAAPEELCGPMATLVFPGPAGPGGVRYDDPLQEALVHRHRIQVPVWRFSGRRIMRISSQLYNSIDQYERLADALRQELGQSAV